MDILLESRRREIFFADFAPTLASTLPSGEVSTVVSLARGRRKHRIRRNVNVTSSSHETSSSNAWFDVLDQRCFTVGHERLTAQVAGIHVVGSDTWIQIEFAENQQRSVLLQLSPDTGVGAAVEAIEHSLRRRTGVSPWYLVLSS